MRVALKYVLMQRKNHARSKLYFLQDYRWKDPFKGYNAK
jgi:hypothetical protein